MKSGIPKSINVALQNIYDIMVMIEYLFETCKYMLK